MKTDNAVALVTGADRGAGLGEKQQYSSHLFHCSS